MKDYEIVIGLEVHVELSTNSKLFCGCSTKFGSEPNTQVCLVCSGIPGVLPVLNNRVVGLTLRAAVALGCKISEVSTLDRKHYFYPDLPKNYQITQYEQPLAYDGHLFVDEKEIKIKRIHLEEDAGKLVHSEDESGDSFIDLNRSGIPLIEIVTEPDIRSSSEAETFLSNLKHILEYLEVSDCNMEEGSLRCDANISVMRKGDTSYGVKTEIKNLNSFKAVRKALDYEALRHISILENNEKVVQETRLWNETLEITEGMRNKEKADDYRYFPDPDLTPIYLDKEILKETFSQGIELPLRRKERLIKEYNLSEYDATTLTAKKEVVDYFEETVIKIKNPKIAANWIMGDLMALLKDNKVKIYDSPITTDYMSQLLILIEEDKITGTTAKEVLYESFKTGKSPDVIVSEKKLIQISDEEFIKRVVKEVLQENPKAIEDYKEGKKQTMGFLVGQVMKKTKGKANPSVATQYLINALKEL